MDLLARYKVPRGRKVTTIIECNYRRNDDRNNLENNNMVMEGPMGDDVRDRFNGGGLIKGEVGVIDEREMGNVRYRDGVKFGMYS